MQTAEASELSAIAEIPESFEVVREGQPDAAWLAGGSAVTFLGGVIGRGLHVLGQVVLARVLGPATFGLYSIGWTIVRICSIFTPLGLENGVIHFISQAEDQPSRARAVWLQCLGLSLLSGLVFGVGLYFLAPVLAIKCFAKPGLVPIFRAFAVTVPLASGLRVASAATRASHSMKYSVWAETIMQPGANLVMVVILYWLGYGVVGAVAAASFSYLAALLLGIGFEESLLPRDSRSKSRQGAYWAISALLVFSVPTAVGVTFTTLINWVDRLLAGAFLAPSSVGVYQAAVQVSIILDVIVSTFNTVFASRISRLHFASETARLDELFKISAKWAFYTSIPAFLVLCCSARELLRLSYGPAYSGGAIPLIILSLGSMADAGSGAAGYLLAFTGHQKRLTVISGVTLVAAILLNYLLIPRFGLIGAAVATAFAHAGVCLAFLITVRSCLGVWPYDRRWLKGLLAGTVTCAIVLLARPLAASSDLGQFLLTLAISLGVFPAALFILGLDPEDKEFVHMIRMRFRSDQIAKSGSH